MPAVAMEFAAQSGKYFHSYKGVLREARSSTASYDERGAAKIWDDSEELVWLQEPDQPTPVSLVFPTQSGAKYLSDFGPLAHGSPTKNAN